MLTRQQCDWQQPDGRQRPNARGQFLNGNLPECPGEFLELLTYCSRTQGDIASLRLGGEPVLLFNHPNHVEFVLATGHRHFTKVLKRHLRPLFGQGLFMSEGDLWHEQRRLTQPVFQRQRASAHGATIGALTNRLLATWRDSQVRDVYVEMKRLLLEITARTIFGIDESQQVLDFGDSLEAALQCIEFRLTHRQWVPGWLPTPNNLRLRRAIRRLDAIVYRRIKERPTDGGERDDFLAALQQAHREPGGKRMSDRQLRDEAMNLFLAGRETTALALAWTLYLLAHNPRTLPELEAELRRVLGGRAPTVADLASLRYTERVVMESLRLYPPAYALKRQAIDAVEIGGHHVPAGTVVIVAQWVLHRDPRYFNRPLAFEPNRWADGLPQRLPRFAYFPFGGGPRFCIGNSLALMTAVLVLATLAQRFRFAPVPGQVVSLGSGPTLRPWPGIPLVLKARNLEP